MTEYANLYQCVSQNSVSSIKGAIADAKLTVGWFWIEVLMDRCAELLLVLTYKESAML